MFSSLQAYLFRRSCKDAQPVRQPVFHGWEAEGLLSQVASQWHGMLQLAPVLQQAQFTHRYASFFQERLGIPPGFQQGAVAIVEEQIRPHIVEKGKLTDIGYILRASSVIAGQLSTQSDIIIIEEPENHSL